MFYTVKTGVTRNIKGPKLRKMTLKKFKAIYLQMTNNYTNYV